MKNTDEKFLLVYDETNNARKIYVDNGKFNVGDVGDFVLGGLALPPGYMEPPISELRTRMRLDAGIKDIKLRHIGKGRFLDLIDAKKMAPFLDWFLENELLIHFSHIDPFYWALADIVDSLLTFSFFEECIGYQYILKSDLFESLNQNQAQCLDIIERYNFPDIRDEDIPSFFAEIIMLVEMSNAILPDRLDALLVFLNEAMRVESLPFLSFEDPGVRGMLMDKFGAFYRHRLVLFKNSVHVLDEELEVKAFLENDIILSVFPEIDFKFVKSDDDSRVQISDLIIGLLGKLFTDLGRFSLEEIVKQAAAISAQGKTNLVTLDKIISRSESLTQAFHHHVCSGYKRNKFEKLLLEFK
ncbi:MAG TPA: hypothetical protein VIG33_18360 [Pseudobdellovibrionaceae bacterium]